VTVSNYHHNLKAGNIPPDCGLDEFVPMFLAAKSDHKCGIWADHVTSWLAMRENHDGFALLRYEDLIQDPIAALSSVTAFLETSGFPAIDRSERNLRHTIDLSSANRLRALEKTQGVARTKSHTSREKLEVRKSD